MDSDHGGEVSQLYLLWPARWPSNMVDGQKVERSSGHTVSETRASVVKLGIAHRSAASVKDGSRVVLSAC